MIQDNFDLWNLRESLGDGTETFEEKLEMYGNLRNLHFSNFPKTSGELDDARGKLSYRIELEMDNSALESIRFYLTSIDLELSVVKEEDAEPEEMPFSLSEEDLKKLPEKNIEIEVGKFPLYLESLEINFVGGDFKNPHIEARFGSFS